MLFERIIYFFSWFNKNYDGTHWFQHFLEKDEKHSNLHGKKYLEENKHNSWKLNS